MNPHKNKRIAANEDRPFKCNKTKCKKRTKRSKRLSLEEERSDSLAPNFIMGRNKHLTKEKRSSTKSRGKTGNIRNIRKSKIKNRRSRRTSQHFQSVNSLADNLEEMLTFNDIADVQRISAKIPQKNSSKQIKKWKTQECINVLTSDDLLNSGSNPFDKDIAKANKTKLSKNDNNMPDSSTAIKGASKRLFSDTIPVTKDDTITEIDNTITNIENPPKKKAKSLPNKIMHSKNLPNEKPMQTPSCGTKIVTEEDKGETQNIDDNMDVQQTSPKVLNHSLYHTINASGVVFHYCMNFMLSSNHGGISFDEKLVTAYEKQFFKNSGKWLPLMLPKQNSQEFTRTNDIEDNTEKCSQNETTISDNYNPNKARQLRAYEKMLARRERNPIRTTFIETESSPLKDDEQQQAPQTIINIELVPEKKPEEEQSSENYLFELEYITIKLMMLGFDDMGLD